MTRKAGCRWHVLPFLFFIVVASDSNATDLYGKISIIDGDTLEVQGTRVRLEGIDAAETAQRCVNSQHKFVRLT